MNNILSLNWGFGVLGMFAGAAPFGPEVDQDRGRGFQDVGVKALVGDFYSRHEWLLGALSLGARRLAA